MREAEVKRKAAVIFRKAAGYIRRRGWQVTGMGEDGQPRCSMGALASAYPAKKWDKKLAESMYKSLYQELNGLTLTDFNYRYKNGERVAQLFDKVANRLVNDKLTIRE